MSNLLRPSNGTKEVRSGLASLKRSWSGNSHDLGAEPNTENIGPSSQSSVISWSPSPPPSFRTLAPPPKGVQKESQQPDTKRMKSQESSFVSASDMLKAYSYNNQGDRSHSISRSTSSSSFAVPSKTASSRNLPWMRSASELQQERRGKPAHLASVQSLDTFGLGETAKAVNKLFLSTEQRAVLNMVVNEAKNVFFTGSAGTGKSVLLREIIKELRHKYVKKQDAIAVTASTGIAACNIGGVTLHSFGGIGLGKESAQILLNKIKRNRKAVSRWVRTQVLIIDEISMVDPSLLDKLDEIARLIRKKALPFGGIQVVITGDFFQLPPVNPGGTVTFAFEAKCWEKVVAHKVNLTQVFRQKDSTFVTMLNEMRFGKLTPKTIAAFQTLSRQPKYHGDITPTELFPMRDEVERANMARLRELDTETQTYLATDSGTLDKEGQQRVLQNCLAVPSLQIKVGAQVMLIKNLDEVLVNGSLGKVIAFMNETEYAANATRIDPDSSAAGMGAEVKKPTMRTSLRKWPLVRFHLPNGGGVRDYLTKPESWKTELPDGEVQAARAQVPLILAWAISIHKSQGQTLPCCKINLNRVFEKGQAYVALSRATSLEGLQVLGFNENKVMAHPKVIRWSQSLLRIDNASQH